MVGCVLMMCRRCLCLSTVLNRGGAFWASGDTRVQMEEGIVVQRRRLGGDAKLVHGRSRLLATSHKDKQSLHSELRARSGFMKSNLARDEGDAGSAADCR